MKIKVKTKYDTYYKKEGTKNTGESKTDKTQFEDSDIKCCLEKYGMGVLLNQTMAQEPLYLDNRYSNLNVADAVRLQDELSEYYKKLPALVRKQFGDNVNVFYEKFKQGEFNEMIATGILTEEYAKELTNEKIQGNTESTSNTTTTNNQNNGSDIPTS